MTTEEEAREATDGQEVQVEAVDHLHEQLDNKISSNKEIKGEAKLMDSTEEMLRIPDDQVLVEAPSAIKISSEHDLNGMAPLNGHVDKLEKISNGQPHENIQNNEEQVEASPDQTSTDPSNTSDEEVAIHSLSRRESASEDTILPKCENEDPIEHGQQNLESHVMDDSIVQEELKVDNPIEQTADVQQGLESSKATEDTQPASMENIPDVEVVVEAPAGVQSPLEPNIDGTTETDEPDKADDPTCLDHKENFPEDTDGEYTEEVTKVEGQLNKQAENKDADVVQEEIPESEKTDLPKIEHVDEASVDDQAAVNPQDIDGEHTEEVAKVEDQQNEQAENTDADVVQEEITESEKIDVPKIEHADEASIDDQAAVNEEPALETNGSVSVEAEEPCHQSNVVTSEEKVEETCHQSNVVTSEEITPEDDPTTREPFVDTQEVQDEGSIQEMEGAEAVDTEETVQQSSAAFDEAIPEDQVTATDPSSDFQQVQNEEPEEIKSTGVDKAAEITSQSNVAFAEDADDDKVMPCEPTADIQPAQGLEQEESKNTATVEMDDTSNITEPTVFTDLDQEDDLPTGEPHVKELAEEAVVLSNLDQEDSIVASEPHVTELAEEAKDIKATETEDITHQSHVDTSQELPIDDKSTASEPHHDDIQQALQQDSVEVKDTEDADDQGICHEGTNLTPEEDTVGDNVTAEGQTCVTQEVQDAEPAEEKDTKAENVAEVSNVAAVNDTDQENSVLISEEIAEEKRQGLESEEKSNTEPIETEAGSDQTHAAPYNDSAQEDTATESAAVEITENKDTETEAILQESHVSVSEDPTPEDGITASEATCNTRGVNIEGSTEAIEDDKDTKTEEISDESNEVFAGEAAEGNDILEYEPTADIQPMQELESEEIKKAELVEVSETSHQMHAVISQTPTQEDNPTTFELPLMESAEVSNIEAAEAQVTPQQSNVTQSEEQATEENTIASEPQILEAEPVQQMKDDEVTEPEGISQQSSVSAFEDSVPEEDVTAKEPAYDDKEIQTDEPELIKEHEDVKAEEIYNQSSESIIAEASQEKHLLGNDPTHDVQLKELETDEIRNIADVETEEVSRQTHAAAVEDSSTENESHMIESSDQTRSIEPTGPEPTFHEGNFASLEEIPTQDNATNEQDIGHQEQESVEIQETETIEPQGIIPSHNVSTSEEFNPKENVAAEEPSSVTQGEESSEVNKATEDVESNAALSEEATPEEHVLATEAAVDTPPVQEPEPEEIKNIEAVEAEARDLPAEETNAGVNDTEAMSHESTAASIKELGEDVKINDAFAEEAAPEEHILQTEAVVDVPSVQEPEQEEVKNTEPELVETEYNITAPEPVLEEVKNTEPEPESEPVETEHNITASDLPAEEMDTEATQTEAIPQESSVASNKELTEDDAITASEPHADIQQVPEQESIEDMNCTDNTEHTGETQQNIACISDELTPAEENTIETNSDTQQVQSPTDQEIKDSQDVKTEDFSDHGVFSTSEEAVQESDVLKSEPASDAQQVQEPASIESAESVETEVDQHNGVSTFEEPVPENNMTEAEPKVGDQHAQEDKLAGEVKENEAMETEEISKRIDITTPENAAQECTEPGSERTFDAQPSQKIELNKDSEDSQPVKEKTSRQSDTITLVDPTTEDSVANEIDPPVDINQEHELGSLEEVKDTNATEAEEASHTAQDASLDEKSSESNIATAEPTSDIQQVNDVEETEEIKVTEAISGEEICYPQTSTLEDPSPTDNAMAPQEYLVESNEVNLGNEIDNVNLVHERIKDEIQESAELKDEAPKIGEETRRGENITEEDAVQISSEDTIQSSSDINPIEEEEKDSSQMPSDQCEENITHVQDRDIKEESLIERGSAEASQASVENDPQAAQDVAEKCDTANVSENTSDQDNEQLHDVVLQTQVCETSMDTLVTGQQDEAVKEVLDQQQKEDEEIEKQKEELQTDEQKHDDKSADSSTETQVETKSVEIGITNRTEDTEAFQGEQTDKVVTEMLKSEECQHISEDSIPIADAMVENITERKEEIEQENGPNNADPLDASVENYYKDEQENAEKDEALAETSNSEQDDATNKIKTEEDEPCLASSVERDLQDISDSAPSNEQMQENNPVPPNVEYGGHGEDKECTNKVIADVHGIQETEKDNVDEVKEKQEMQNEDNDDTPTSCAEINHEKASTHPREIEETVVETSKQNNVDQDLSIHHKIEDGILGTEHNFVEVEAMQQRVDSPSSETNNDDVLSITDPFPEHETKTASDINQTRQDQEAINANDVQQLEAEENAFVKIETDSVEKMETNYTEDTKVVTFNEDICDKASGADGEPSDENLKTLEDNRRNLDVSSVVSASEGESMDKEMEDHKLALPAHPTEEESTNEHAFVLKETQGEFTLPENPLPAEPEEQEEKQATKEQDEEDSHETETVHTHEEAEQGELPVSHFLMNLILGKESNDLNGNSEAETEKKQQENMKDDKTISQQEDLVSFPTETKVDDKFTFEQEKQNVKACEETHDIVKEQNNDFQPDNERSLGTDEELNKNTNDLEAPVYQDNAQDENSSELVSALAAGLVAKMEARDFEFHEKAFDTVCQENVEAAKEVEKESLESTQDESTSPKVSQEDALEEGTTELSHESLHEHRSSDEQTLSLTEPDVGDATILPNEADRVQSPPCTKQEQPIESSHAEVKSNTEVQMESEEVEKKEENQHTDIGRDIEEERETLHGNTWKGTDSEVIADEQVPEITEPVSHSEIDLAHEKEIQAGSTSVDEKESYKLSNNEVGNFEKALEIHSDSPNLHVNEHKQDESADNQIVMENNSLPDKPEIDSNLQKQKETDIARNIPTETETDEEGHKFMVTAEPVIKENVHETVESQMQTVKIKSNEEQEVFDSQVQDRGLDVVSPKAASEVEENFVEVTKPEFSTDEEQSPKADEPNMAEKKTYEGKIKDEEETKNFTDEVTIPVEERGAGQKTSPKKNNILSVVSKVKHQLAKVKKTIIGKPGNTKSESPKS